MLFEQHMRAVGVSGNQREDRSVAHREGLIKRLGGLVFCFIGPRSRLFAVFTFYFPSNLGINRGWTFAAV